MSDGDIGLCQTLDVPSILGLDTLLDQAQVFVLLECLGIVLGAFMKILCQVRAIGSHEFKVLWQSAFEFADD